MSYTVSFVSHGGPDNAPVTGTIVLDGSNEAVNIPLGFVPSRFTFYRKTSDAASSVVECFNQGDGTFSCFSQVQTGVRSWVTAAVYLTVYEGDGDTAPGVTLASTAGQVSTDDLGFFEAHR